MRPGAALHRLPRPAAARGAFDDRRATIDDVAGRVLDPETSEPIPGLYTAGSAGWIERGPSGIIGTNKKCANDTIGELAQDHAAGKLPARTESGDVAELLAERAPDHVDFDGWLKIDAHEQALGEPRPAPASPGAPGRTRPDGC